jgi:hypothetical protein
LLKRYMNLMLFAFTLVLGAFALFNCIWYLWVEITYGPALARMGVVFFAPGADYEGWGQAGACQIQAPAYLGFSGKIEIAGEGVSLMIEPAVGGKLSAQAVLADGTRLTLSPSGTPAGAGVAEAVAYYRNMAEIERLVRAAAEDWRIGGWRLPPARPKAETVPEDTSANCRPSPQGEGKTSA